MSTKSSPDAFVDIFAVDVSPIEMARILTLSEQELVGLSKDGILQRKTIQRGGRRVIVYNVADTVQKYIWHLDEPFRRAREELMIEKRDTARIIREHKRLDLDFASGDLVKRSRVKSSVSNTLTIVKNQLLGMPTRVTRLVVGQPFAKVHAIISHDLRLILRNLTDFDFSSFDEPQQNGQHADEDASTRRRKKRIADRRRRH
jgi:hypothetical protein